MFPVSCQVQGLGRALLEERHAQGLVSPNFNANMQEYAKLKASDTVTPEAAARMAGLGDWLGDHAKRMQGRLMKAAIKAAAIQTGVTLALNAIPVVGKALGLVYGQFASYRSGKYQKRCEDYTKSEQKKMKAFTDGWQKKLDEALAAAYKKAYRGAIELALSNQPLIETTHTAEDFINPGTQGLGFSALDGSNVWKVCKRNIDEMVSTVKKAILGAVPPQIDRVNERGFTDALRVSIAREIRKNPNVLLYYKLFGAGTPLDYLRDVVNADKQYEAEALKKAGYGQPTAPVEKTGMSTPVKLGIAAAAVGGAVLLMKG